MSSWTNFIAHEPALGHLGGALVESGGAGFAVTEQTLALNRHRAAARAPHPPVRVLCPAPARRRPLPSALPMSYFRPPALRERDRALLGDQWLTILDRLLGSGACAAHHVLASQILMALGRPFACHLHSLWPSVADACGVAPDPARADAARMLLPRAAAIVVATEAERTLLVRTAVPADERPALLAKTWVVPPGINPRIDWIARRTDDARARAAWRRRLVPDATPSTPVFYNVGRIVPHKRHASIVQAFVRIARVHRDARLLLVGMPTHPCYARHVRELVRAAPTHTRRRITWYRALPIEAAHLAGDMLIHASTLESWGKVIDEAFALGNPTIVSALPTTAEKAGYAFRDRGTTAARDFATQRFMFSPIGDDTPRSLLVDPADVESIAAALHRAVTDRSWRRACRDYNRARAEHLRWPRLVGRLTRVWESVETRSGRRFERAA